jgi:hypothetical protein
LWRSICADLDRNIVNKERIIAGLQAQLRTVSPTEKPGILKQIGDENKELADFEKQKVAQDCA